MSSNSHAGPDAIVTVKVTYSGVPFRAKLPLREMVPRVLEEHLRSFLPIPADTKIMIERYSDSAAAYVMLDASNLAVYKQLYRAAKAKSKLKLRVSALPNNDEVSSEKATVEDAPEVAQADATSTTESIDSKPASVASASSSRTTLSRKYDATLLQEAARLIKDHQADFDNRIRQVMRSSDELASLTSKMASCQPFLTTSDDVSKPSDPLPPVCPAIATRFTVCCNSCEKNIPDAHYHCSTCNDGDFDLCESCVGQGITCYSDDHWLIKRSMSNGQIVNSTTETMSPKLKAKPEPLTQPMTQLAKPLDDLALPAGSHVTVGEITHPPSIPPVDGPWPSVDNMRTCNQCVRELPEREFLHCTNCEDYDLCQPCFISNAHGHHPKHGFAAAVPGTQIPADVRLKMAPGRNQVHHAICDACDTYIHGVRHKCLDCPDWDYCVQCVKNAHLSHPGHRFVAIYEPLTDVHAATVPQPVHVGICCDGPLCNISRATRATSAYIRGIRYKCAVCHDVDFCANCEASPANSHNKTHPMLKFKTPVRHVTVTTSGEHEDGKRMPTMGDRMSTNSKATETVPTSSTISTNTINAVQTVIDVKPVEAVLTPPPPPPRPAKEPMPVPMPQVKLLAPPASEAEPKEDDLDALFLRDTVADGTIFPPNHVFQQTWVLRNNGKATWPSGCFIKYIGGDYMGHVDSTHPAGVSELVSASESTICCKPLAPGQEWAFAASLRAPSRPGRFISYWRLATSDGMRFGNRLWCEVNVRNTTDQEVEHSAPSTSPPTSSPIAKTEEAKDDNQASSMMIFPKLENESASASILKETQTETKKPVCGAVSKGESDKREDEDDEDDEWDGSENEDSFMTDEEYDILDASDEEFLQELQKKKCLNE
ncbi:hypothetical protein E4U55_007885 [Claviceps digitariae]|nr:hypothetical protein E4U55_007885 [Claviceps digitariae]